MIKIYLQKTKSNKFKILYLRENLDSLFAKPGIITMVQKNEIEYLDLVDENDIVIGKESRDKIYAQGLKNYRVANIFVFNSLDKILLPRRDGTRKIFPNCYDFSCGEHVTSGETYNHAALRGLEEELNLSNIQIKTLGKLSPKDGVSSFMEIYKVVYDKNIIPNKKEGIESISFVPLDELKNMIIKNPDNFKDDLSKVINLLSDKL